MNDARTILGIDPGLSGALTYLTGDELEIFDIPTYQVKRGSRKKRASDPLESPKNIPLYKRELDIDAVVRIVNSRAESTALAIIERVNAMPEQGIASTFQFGRTAGILEGIVASNFIAREYVVPRVWRAKVGVRGGKDGSRSRASELFPASAALWARKKDDGRAESALIALYGRRMFTQEPDPATGRANGAAPAPGEDAEPPMPLFPDAEAAETPAAVSEQVAIDAAVEAWNVFAKDHKLPSITTVTDRRRKRLAGRLKDCGGIAGWHAALAMIPKSSFLLGNNDRGWKANFNWILQPDSFAKLREGGYPVDPPQRISPL